MCLGDSGACEHATRRKHTAPHAPRTHTISSPRGIDASEALCLTVIGHTERTAHKAAAAVVVASLFSERISCRSGRYLRAFLSVAKLTRQFISGENVTWFQNLKMVPCRILDFAITCPARNIPGVLDQRRHTPHVSGLAPVVISVLTGAARRTRPSPPGRGSKWHEARKPYHVYVPTAVPAYIVCVASSYSSVSPRPGPCDEATRANSCGGFEGNSNFVRPMYFCFFSFFFFVLRLRHVVFIHTTHLRTCYVYIDI